MPEPSKKLSRRDAIKLLGAAAGASVLATLPTKWTKPEITAGVLPAHAQTSACVILALEALSGQGQFSLILAQGPLPSSQTPSNYITSSPSNLVTVPLHYQAVWSCMSGCVQLFLGGTVGQVWRVKVTGPNPSQNDYAPGAQILTDLSTGLFSSTYNSNAPGSCIWIYVS